MARSQLGTFCLTLSKEEPNLARMATTQVAERVRELRVSLDISQEQLAERGGLLRTEVSKIEGGHNKATSFAMRQSLATGFGLSLEDVVELLEGETPVATIRKRCRIAGGAAA